MKWLSMLSLLVSLSGQAATESPVQPGPTIEVGILLDTSGSMQGLIDQTRSRLWKLINKLDDVSKLGLPVKVKVGLFQYGSGDPELHDQGYIQQIAELTPDHDHVSKELFALKATGSQEYSGLAIQKAVQQLSFADNDLGIKTLFLAGNETLKQGPVAVETAIAQALAEDIIVNTIYADNNSGFSSPRIPSKLPIPQKRGPQFPSRKPHPLPGPVVDHVLEEWKAAAHLGLGSFTVINSVNKLPTIKAPQDKKILKLDQELNTTFVPFGKNGAFYLKRMLDLDSDIGGSSASDMVNRGRYKAGNHFDTTSWDLVEASKNPNFDFASLKPSDLSDELKGKPLSEIKAYVARMSFKREKIKEQIKALYVEREIYVQSELKRLEEEGKGDPIDTVMFEALAEQLVAKGFNIN